MYEQERGFHTPDFSTVVWRYMDLDKFIDLLKSRQLYFCRSDYFEDPMEGLLQLKDFEQTREIFKIMPLTKKFYFLNCWHMNESQSDGMWRLYTKDRMGVAIKSDVGRIVASLQQSKEAIHISTIKYRDFSKVTFNELTKESQNQVFPGFSSTNQFTYKREEFSHEKELRLYYIDRPIPHAIKEGVAREPLDFKRIPIHIETLVEEVIVSPFASDEYCEKVRKLIYDNGLAFKTKRSDLYQIKN